MYVIYSKLVLVDFNKIKIAFKPLFKQWEKNDF